jgi:hypothetical protein
MQPEAANQETHDIVGSMGPTEQERVVPKVLKKKIILPITGEVDLPRAVREAMEYRVEVVPMVLEEGTIAERSELKPEEKPVAYTVLRRGNALDGLNPQFSPTVDRYRIDAREDPQAAEKALQLAQDLAAQKLDMDQVIPGYREAAPESRDKLLRSVFRDTLDGWREPANAPEQSPDPSLAKPVPEKVTPAAGKATPKNPEPGTEELLEHWPQGQSQPLLPKSPESVPQRPVFERKAPVALLTHKNRPLVLDYGDHITVTRRAMLGIGSRAREKREQAVTTALQAAVQRFGEPIHFEGNPKFLRETAEMAVKLGIRLEPGSKLAEQVYKEAQERAVKARGNTLEPARKTEPQKSRQQDIGLER